MNTPEGIELLSAEDQVKVYTDLAAHFASMAARAHSNGAKLVFSDMAREMRHRADAVTTFAP